METLPIWLFVASLQLEDLAVKFSNCVHNLLNAWAELFGLLLLQPNMVFPKAQVCDWLILYYVLIICHHFHFQEIGLKVEGMLIHLP